MDYQNIFDLPPWESLALSVLQTATLFCLLLVGLRLIGRRILAERDPQDLIIIVLVAEACDMGLTDERAGYWGTFASVITIFLLGFLADRISIVRKLLSEKPIILYNKGRLHHHVLKKNNIKEDDLNEVARENGFPSYKDFKTLVLERDGNISAVQPVTGENISPHQVQLEGENGKRRAAG